MRIPRVPHRWSLSPKKAIEWQRHLAPRVIRTGRVDHPKLLAGLDLALTASGDACIAGVVVWDVSSRSVVEEHTACRPLRFPYVPGLLSFREAPALIAALRKLCREPDAFLFDGQGYAHPRRFGLASHVGVLIDRPSVGVAKSLLVGDVDRPGTRRGALARIVHRGECVGMAVRTRDNVKPVFVSVGHKVSLESAVDVALLAGDGYRLPEPTRLADRLVARAKRNA